VTGAAEAVQDWVRNLQLRSKFWVRKAIILFHRGLNIGCAICAPLRIRFRRPCVILVIINTLCRYKVKYGYFKIFKETVRVPQRS
jgi:hypothetical protein